MHTSRTAKVQGNVLICALCTIVVLSIIGGTVLHNSTTRLNVSVTQVRAWKDALAAAESGGDIAFAELRKSVPEISPAPSPSPWSSGWSPASPAATHTSNVINVAGNVQTQAVVEACYFDSDGTFHLGQNPGGHNWYRVRSKGTVLVPGLKRASMDDALTADGRQHFAAFGSTAMSDITARSKGDSLLRKIDFKYDHFVATYGPNGDGTGQTQVTVTTPQVSRRIEQIVAPVSSTLFTAAIKTSGTFYGLGSAAMLDSYDSSRGPYRFVANNPSDPDYSYSREGNVQANSSNVTLKGTIYGDVSTNGANVRGSSNVTGTIDNNVPFTQEDYHMPDTSSWQYRAPGSGPGQLPTSITSDQNLTPPTTGTADSPNYYVVSRLSDKLTVNANTVRNPDGTYSPVDTYVAVRVNGGDITGAITVNPKVHLKVYFDYNIDMKNDDVVNQSPSATNPIASNLQFYGISPPRDANGNPIRTQSIQLDSETPHVVAATFYAPSADMQENGNPDFIGAVVCKSFYANGNVAWHYDLALNNLEGELLDYRIISYVEDTR
jgi:hypothetical protein